jgi:hypothetical protein
MVVARTVERGFAGKTAFQLEYAGRPAKANRSAEGVAFFGLKEMRPARSNLNRAGRFGKARNETPLRP